jgi:hypothetical protein
VTPWVQKRGRTFPIDRRFAGIGRIARASGTDHPPTFKAINDMLTALAGVESLRPYLQAIYDGDLEPLVALHHYKRGTLASIPIGKGSSALLAAFREFTETHVVSDSYRDDLKTSLRHLERAARTDTPVASLPDVLRRVKKRMTETPVAFHRLRAHCLSFAAETTGELSPLWTEIKRVRRFRGEEGTRPKRKQRRGLTVAELDAVAGAFRDYSYRRGNSPTMGMLTGETQRGMLYALAFTGMRPVEYWQRGRNRWSDVSAHVSPHVWVEGTKTVAAKRPTLRLIAPVPPGCGEQKFRALFTEATERALREGLELYSLRYTFQKLCEDAGIPESRRRAYHGHGKKSVTEIYLRTKLVPHVPGDTAFAARWIADERARMQTRNGMEVVR